MLTTYKAILSLFRNIQEELKDEPIIIDVRGIADHFVSEKSVFQNNSTKVIFIGSTSVGKTTMINKLLERDIYGSQGTHGTISFFYTTATLKSYEYFTIHGTHEITDINILKNATRIDYHLQGYINVETEITTYLFPNNNRFLNKYSMIVDGPGLEQEENYRQKIENQCEFADIMVFLFDVEQRARHIEMDFVRNILNKNENLVPLFVYNKCDKVNLENDLIDLKNDFRETFRDLFQTNYKMDIEKLYFLSGIQLSDNINNSFLEDEYERFKNELLTYINAAFIRTNNVFSNSLKKLGEVDGFLKDLSKLKMRTKNDLVSKNKETQKINDSMTNTNERLIRQIKRETEHSIQLLKQKNMETEISRMITLFKGSCDKDNAAEFVIKMTDKINNDIICLLQTHVKFHWQNEIANEIINQHLGKIDDVNFALSTDVDFINRDIDLDIFWWFEFGDKTLKVKQHVRKCITDKWLSILVNIYNYYENEVTKFGKQLEKGFVNTIELNTDELDHQNQEIEKLADIIETINNYSDSVRGLVTKLKLQLEKRE